MSFYLLRLFWAVVPASALQSLAAISDALPNIAVVAHHRTGTEFGREISHCLLRSKMVQYCSGLGPAPGEPGPMGPGTASHYEGTVPDGCKLVHMVRPPLDIVKSSYTYSKEIPAPEKWMTRPMSEKWSHFEHVPNPPIDLESVSSYYNRVNSSDGILVEMLTTAAHSTREMEDAFFKTQHDDRVLTVDLTTVFDDFEGTMRKMYRHFELDEKEIDPSLKKCIGERDPAATKNDHASASKLTSQESQRLNELILRYDAELSKYVSAADTQVKNNMYAQSPLASQGPMHLKEDDSSERRVAYIEAMA